MLYFPQNFLYFYLFQALVVVLTFIYAKSAITGAAGEIFAYYYSFG
jgi:membrane associated rhomboid family serine protease